jgi:hypothetical protein
MNNNFSKKYLAEGNTPPFYHTSKEKSVYECIIQNKDVCNTYEQKELQFENSYVKSYADKIDFKKPAFLGDLISMRADIKAFGRSSIQVKITVTRESQSGDIEEICAANFTFVTMKNKKSHPHELSFERLSIKK